MPLKSTPGWFACVACSIVAFLAAIPALGSGMSPSLPLPRRTPPIDTVHFPLAKLPLRGGSNFLWYTLGEDCTFEPYGILANYQNPAVRTQVRAELAGMFGAGMARLSLGVFFAHGLRDGTVLDSSDPAQVALATQNVAELLADAKAAGFRQILFRFFPVGAINPNDANYDPSLVDEHFNFIRAIRPVLVDAGIAYLIDLSIEGAPRDSDLPIVSDPWKYPANPNWSYGVRALWQNYFKAYGSSDTIGFSFLTDADPEKLHARVRHMRYVYEGNYPQVFALDIYGVAGADESAKFLSFDQAMREEDSANIMGWRDASLIIAETYYDDPVSAENLKSAMQSSQRRVLFLTQWPLDRGADAPSGGTCAGTNVVPPFTWTVFGAFGF